ncbi:MAG TPA: TRAP transporter substrate-binding protein [Hyphomicrobiaceae bacterium]|nr:TRAP transporter substrate-binding protein [Hyphomicrobiaceae bacterium]
MSLMLKTVSAFAITGLLAVPAAAQTKWDMPVPYGEGNFHTKNIQQFAKEISDATGGKLTIQVHPSGSLFKHPEIKPSVRRGLAPIGEILASLASNESPIFGVDSVPFLTGGYADARKLYAAQKPFLEKRLDGEGLKLLYSVPWPPQGLYTRKEIKAIGDLSGLKFRTYNAATSRLAQLIKAVPTQIEVPDIPTAFQTGRVEAMITSPATGVDSKAWDFLTHYNDLQGWQPRNIVFVNKAAFDKLPADQQKAMLTAAAAAEKRGWEVSESETARTTNLLADNKITVYKPTPELRDALMKIGATMTQEWEKSAGADGAALLKAYRGK